MAATRSATSSIATRAKVNCSSRFTAAILIRLFCELIEGSAKRDIVVAHRDRSPVIRARLSGAHKLGVTMRIHQW